MRQTLKKLLYPGRFPAFLVTAAGGGSLYFTFRTSLGNTPLAYAAYGLSSYALTVFTAWGVPAFAALWRRLRGVPIIHRYLSDKYFAASCGLVRSFFINLGFAVFKLRYAWLYASRWDGALAAYNVLLCGIQLFLVLRLRRDGQEQDFRRELSSRRAIGFFLLVLDLALSAIATQIVVDGYGYEYPGMLIYTMAVYTFYSLTLAIINTIRYRKLNNPLLSSIKLLNLTTALVAVFNLETAMLTQFGAEEGEEFRLVMTACTAFAVCVTVLGMAVCMTLHSGATKKTERVR